MRLSIFTILLLITIFCIPDPISAENPNQLLIGGPIRSGSFSLTNSATENLETSLSYEDSYVENFFGKLLMIEYSLGNFNIGGRWTRYQLIGESEEYDQVLDVDYTLLTLGFTFLNGDFIHPRLNSRLGFTIGKGQSEIQLVTKTSHTKILQNYKDTFTSIKPTDFIELFFDAVSHSGWGYRMGYFSFFSDHDSYRNGDALNASSSPQLYMTLIWKY